MALIGLRDVRDYRIRLRPDAESLGTSSPFNIKVESLTLRNFTAEEVAELYDQHTAETGQVFTAEAKALAFQLTRGQPWLVNALARQAVEVLVTDRSIPIEASHIERAKEILIERRDTHLDSLIDRLREPRVRRVLEPILAGEFLAPDVLDDDIQFVEDLGLVARSAGLEIANPIYREIIPRALTAVTQRSLPLGRASFVEGRRNPGHRGAPRRVPPLLVPARRALPGPAALLGSRGAAHLHGLSPEGGQRRRLHRPGVRGRQRPHRPLRPLALSWRSAALGRRAESLARRPARPARRRLEQLADYLDRLSPFPDPVLSIGDPPSPSLP